MDIVNIIEFRHAPFPTGNGIVSLHCAGFRRTSRPPPCCRVASARSVSRTPSLPPIARTSAGLKYRARSRRSCKVRLLTIDQLAVSTDLYHPFLSQREHRAKADAVAAAPRQYSLPPPAPVPVPPSSTEASTWRIAVLREPAGRGGSLWLHDSLTEGGSIRVRGPRPPVSATPCTTPGVRARRWHWSTRSGRRPSTSATTEPGWMSWRCSAHSTQ